MSINNEEKRLIEFIDSERDRAIQFLRDLVKTVSVCGEEGKAQDLVRQKLKEDGFEVEEFKANLDEIRNNPEYTIMDDRDVPKDYSKRPNIIGKYRGRESGQSLLLFGHIDTVPVGKREDWKFDPLEGEISGGRMYGRGTSDMKAGLAAALFALDAIKKCSIKLKGDVIFMSNVDEEVGGNGGILACMAKGYKADAAVYIHPSPGGLKIISVGSSGVLGFRIKIFGKTICGAQSHLGINAIEKAFKVQEGLRDLDYYRGVNVRDEFTEKAYILSARIPRATNMYISSIRAGEWLYNVPSYCEMDWIITFPPGENIQEIRVMIEEYVKNISASDSWLKKNPPEIEWLSLKFSPSRNDLKHPLIILGIECVKEIIETQVEVAFLPVGSDIRIPINLSNIPTIVIGPLGCNQHEPDEWVDIDSYIQTIKSLSLLTLRWCQR